MQVWRYAWTLAPLVGTVALGTVLAVNHYAWIGGAVIGVGALGLLLILLKEIVERPERAHAFYRIDGPQAIYCYSYVEFRRLPGNVRTECLKDEKVRVWYKREMERHAGAMFGAYQKWPTRFRYRATLWLARFLTCRSAAASSSAPAQHPLRSFNTYFRYSARCSRSFRGVTWA